LTKEEGCLTTEERSYAASFEDKGRSHEPRNLSLEVGKGKKVEVSIEATRGSMAPSML
jgi:hypothetical protein